MQCNSSLKIAMKAKHAAYSRFFMTSSLMASPGNRRLFLTQPSQIIYSRKTNSGLQSAASASQPRSGATSQTGSTR